MESVGEGRRELWPTPFFIAFWDCNLQSVSRVKKERSIYSMYTLKADIQSANKSHNHIIQIDVTCINMTNMAKLTSWQMKYYSSNHFVY